MTDESGRTAAPRGGTLASIMTSDVLVIDGASTIREAIEIFSVEGISGAPVGQGGRIVGVVSTTDLLAFRAETTTGDADARWEVGEHPYFSDPWDEDGMELPDAPELDRFDTHTVADIMSPRVYSLPSSASVREGARRLLDLQVHRILVIDEEKLVGLVTTTDIVRAVADGRLSGDPDAAA